MASKLDELMALADAYYHAPTPGTYPWDEIKRDGLRTALQSALKAVVEDAERYRWLRDGADDGEWECFESKWLIKHDVYGQGPADLDAAIDAARKP